MTTYTATEVVGKTQKRNVSMERLYIRLSHNDSQYVNYNRDGVLDNIGFVPVSELFIDNFLVYCLVPEDLLDRKTKKYIHVGSVLSVIWQMLKFHGLTKSRPKAVTLKPTAASGNVLFSSGKCDGLMYKQVYKISCDEENAQNVVDLLRNKDNLEKYSIYLQDVDATMDLAGTFDKTQVVEHLIQHGFRMQNKGGNGDKTIVDNDGKVGKNCLTYMDDDKRCKIYNKFVQSLESGSVRDNVGNHIHDWIVQQGTTLATAREAGINRGVTRAEITFYTDSVPSVDYMETSLLNLVGCVPTTLVYSTPITAQWFTLCDILKHSLILEDPETNSAIVGMFVNKGTDRISGFWVEDYENKRKWCEERLTLQQHLPIDVVRENMDYVLHPTNDTAPAKLASITLHAIRKFKLAKSTTRVISKNVFFRIHANSAEMLVNSGLLPHQNCELELSEKSGNKNSATSMEYIEEPSPILHVLDRKREKTGNLEVNLQEVMSKIERANNRRNELWQYSRAFETVIFRGKLCDLEFNRLYNILAFKEFAGRFGKQYLLAIEDLEDIRVVYGNSKVNSLLESLDLAEYFRASAGYYCLAEKKPIGTITVTGTAWGQRNKIVFVDISMDSDKTVTQAVSKTNGELAQLTNINGREEKEELHVLTREEQPLYSSIADLHSCIGTTKDVIAYGQQKFRGKLHGIVKFLDGTLYRAGIDLESKSNLLSKGSKVRVLKKRIDQNTRKPYAVVEIIEAGDWSCCNYKDLPFVNTVNNGLVVSVKEITVKSAKRKIALLDNGKVYKCKRSKLENSMHPGYKL